MFRTLLRLFGVFFLFYLLTFLTHLPAQAATGDMVSSNDALDACITIVGPLATLPAIQPQTCRGLPQQYWQIDTNGQWHSGTDPTYCLARQNSGSWLLTVFPCTDALTLRLAQDAANPAIYNVIGDKLVLTKYVKEIGLYPNSGYSSQQWRWLQNDLATVTAQGCNIAYPFPASNSATYNRELACDRIAKTQPPYMPPITRNPSVYPGVVAAGAATVTRSFAFNLQFKDHSYLRMGITPRNWQSTGLYAPAGQIVRVVVNNALSTDLTDVYVLLGIHTDQLTPTSPNVQGSNFYRYPNMTNRIKLEPGENLVRTPYGGLITLISESSLNKTIQVEIANAVEAPRFVLGETTATDWLTRRNAPAPWAEIESPTAVIYVPAADVRNLTFADATAVAGQYNQIVNLENELSGLSPTNALPHQSPQGKQRIVEDRQISVGGGHGGYPIMVYEDWNLANPNVAVNRSVNWGVYHEIGHSYQMGAWSHTFGTEVTVNLFSLYVQQKLFGNSRVVDANVYAQAIARLNDPTITDKWSGPDAFIQLVFLDQLRLGFPKLDWDLWTQLMRRYRDLPPADINALNADPARRDKFATILCDITNTNITPHFDAWTIPLSASAKTYCATKPPLTQPIWLIDGAKPTHTGTGAGKILREWWNNSSGANVADLTANSAYPNQPTGSGYLTTALAGPTDWGDNYGQRIRGYLHPPVSGVYTFWLAADESSQLWLSTDDDPLHTKQIINLTQATYAQSFDQYLIQLQRSVALSLTAGNKYYLEVLHKESTGGDHVAVAWTIPAAPGLPGEVRKVIDARYLSPYTGDLVLHQQLSPGQAPAVAPGSDVAYTIQVINQSRSTVKNIRVADTIPAGFSLSPNDTNNWQSGNQASLSTANAEAGSQDGPTSAATPDLRAAATPNQFFGVITGPVAPGATATIKIILRVNPNTAVGTYPNLATLVSAVDNTNTILPDSNTANNMESVSVQVATGTTPITTLTPAATPSPTPPTTPTPTVTLSPSPIATLTPAATPSPTPITTPTPTATPSPTAATPTPTPTVTPVSGCLISLSNGALFTNQRTVTVQSNVPNAAQLQLSNDNGFTNATWQPYKTLVNWTLPDSGQPIAKLVVYARFRDANNNLLCTGSTVTDSVTFDGLAPKVTIVTSRTGGQLQIQAEDQPDGSGIADVQISAQSDFANATWQPWQEMVTVDSTLPSTTFYVRVRDGAGNQSEPFKFVQMTLYLPLVTR